MSKNVLYANEEQYKFLTLGNWDLRYLRVLRSFNSLSGESLPLLYKFPCTFLQQSPTDSLTDYQNLLIDSNNTKNVLPMAVRYVDSCGNHYVERPPFKIAIDYKNDRAYENYPKEFVSSSSGLEMWIPWTIMVIPSFFASTYDVSSVKLYFSHKSLESMSDSYLKMFLPNSYSDSRICMSNSFDHVVSLSDDHHMSKSFDLRYWHSLILNDYMLGGWNSDLESSLLRKLDSLNTDDGRLTEALKKYPILNSYVNIKDFDSILDSAVGVCQTYFGCTKKRSKDIMCRIKAKKFEHKDSYVKFFCYISLLSLEDTLSFYEQIQSFFSEVRDSYYDLQYLCKVFDSIVTEAKTYSESGANPVQLQLPIANYASYMGRNGLSVDGFISDCYTVKTVYIHFHNYPSNFLNKKGICINSGHTLYDPIEVLEQIGVDVGYLITALKNEPLSYDTLPVYSDRAYLFKVDVGLKTIVAVPFDEINIIIDTISLSISSYVKKESAAFAGNRKKSGKTQIQVSNFRDIMAFADVEGIKSLFSL